MCRLVEAKLVAPDSPRVDDRQPVDLVSTKFGRCGNQQSLVALRHLDCDFVACRLVSPQCAVGCDQVLSCQVFETLPFRTFAEVFEFRIWPPFFLSRAYFKVVDFSSRFQLLQFDETN